MCLCHPEERSDVRILNTERHTVILSAAKDLYTEMFLCHPEERSDVRILNTERLTVILSAAKDLKHRAPTVILSAAKDLKYENVKKKHICLKI